jgi:hypothetical protein
MADDQLILAGIIFQNYDYSVPSHMPFGGTQAMIVHKLPGGNRVIDTLGPDEDDISWNGFFFTPNALYLCQQLDALRGQGQQVALTYAGMTRLVVIKHFKANIRRYPHWIEYEISCTVSVSPHLGPISGITQFIAPVAGIGAGVELTTAATGAAAAGAATGALIAADLATAQTSATGGIVTTSPQSSESSGGNVAGLPLAG